MKLNKPTLLICIITILLTVIVPQQAIAASITFTTNTTINSNAIIASGETWTINSGVTVTIASGVTVTIQSGGTIENNGVFQNSSGGTLINNGTITNSNSGTSAFFRNFGTFTNNGTLINNKGQISNRSIFTNSASGQITSSDRINNEIIDTNEVFTNNGSINIISKGVFINFDEVTLINNGTISVNSTITTPSFINKPDGIITNGSGGSITIIAGQFTNDAGAQITNTGTLTTSGLIFSNKGILTNIGTLNIKDSYSNNTGAQTINQSGAQIIIFSGGANF